MWRQFFRVGAVMVLASVVTAALFSLEFADVASRQQVADHHPQQPASEARQKKVAAAQIEVAIAWLDIHRELINVVSTIFIAGFTGTLWWATTRLWRTSKTHAEHTEQSVRVAQRAANAAKSSADAAERTVETMEKTAERQLRAYAHVSDAS